MNKITGLLATGLAVFTIGTTLTACGNTSNQGGQKVSKSSSSKKKEIKYYKIGDSVKVDKVTYTLVSVEKTDERNEFADEKPNNVIKVVYHVKNESDQELPLGTDLEVYGPKNTKLKEYPINNSTLDSLAAGKEADVTTGFGTDDLGNFELQFAPFASLSNSAKFKVNVQ